MNYKVLEDLKTVVAHIEHDHTGLMCASEVPSIETIYYHGDIDDLGEQPLDFVNLHNIKLMVEYLLDNYTEEEYQRKYRLNTNKAR
jgi:hypothetical protein